MLFGVDTNVLLRFAYFSVPESQIARDAMRWIRKEDHQLCCSPQNIIEFWNVSTRPVAHNGYGRSIDGVERMLTLLQNRFVVLPPSTQTLEVWRLLVKKHMVRGAQVHDAHLAASLFANGVTNILTFNTKDFRRYDGLTVVHPRDLVLSE